MDKKILQVMFKVWKLGKRTHFLLLFLHFVLINSAQQNRIQILHSVQTTVLFKIIGLWFLDCLASAAQGAQCGSL